MMAASVIAVTGASGFIGKNLVAELLRAGGAEIRVLSRKRADAEGFGPGVTVFEGDLGDADSLEKFLAPGCSVVNLAYLRDAGEAANRACVQNLLTACARAGVARLLHCSTADVAGRAPGDTVDETARCLPVTEYGRTKLAIEHDIVDFARRKFDVVILRPTAVFGIGGASLNRLASDIAGGCRWKNYLKSCLFGRRSMNLVHVGNVTAAILFLLRREERFDGEVFVVSDDDDPHNDFRDVEDFLMQALGAAAYALPRVPVPAAVLRMLLALLGRDSVNPQRRFDPGRLRRLGFSNPVSLRDGLAEYATAFRAARAGAKGAAG